MNKINISSMLDILLLALLSKDSVHMMGLHGIGKSKIVEQFCKKHNIHLEILMLASQEVSDLVGMPSDEEDENGKVMHWSKPAWLDRMWEAKKAGMHCCLFLDELARAPIEVRQVALSLVLDKTIHEHKLPEYDNLETLVVAADNPPDLYQTDELDAALKDRFMTYYVQADIKGWLKWARENEVLDVVTDFVAEFNENLHMQFPNEDDKGSTPRAWAKLSDILKHIDTVDKSILHAVIESKVGETVGNSFLHHYRDYLKVLKVEDLVNMIDGRSIRTQKEQKEVAEILKPKTQKLEAVSASQLAEKIRVEVTAKNLHYDVLTTYLASLNLEIMLGIIKTWKEDLSDKEFYFDWSEEVPDFWLFTSVTSRKV